MTGNRIEYWDGLRGVAAVVVVLHHLIIGFYPSTYTLAPETVHTGAIIERITHNTPLGIMFNGGLAVAVFLLLSGLVVNLSAKNPQLPGKVADGTVKRFFRFCFPILATNLLAYGFIKLNWPGNIAASQLTGSSWWLGQMWQMQPSLGAAIQQGWGALVSMYPLNQVYNSSVWTMPFFFLGPVALSAFLTLTPEWKRRNLILVVAMILLMRSHFWLIILGYLLAEIPVTKWEWLKKWPMKLLLLVGVIILGNYPQAYDTAAASNLYGKLPILGWTHTSTFYFGLAAAMLVIWVMTSQRGQRLLSAGWCKMLGKISFSLYLGHILVINTVTSWVFLAAIKSMAYAPAFGVSLAASLPVFGLISWGLYQLAEKPSVKFSQVVLAWLSRTNATMSRYARNTW